MRILDRQRYWAFFKAYVICFIALVGLYVVIDAFSNLDEFAKRANGAAEMFQVMGAYYLVHMSQFYDRLCGVIGMMAAIFTVTWMQRNNELLAMLAAGISTQRVIRPVWISVIVVSLLAVLNQELIIPRYGEELEKSHDDDGDRKVLVYGRYDSNSIYIHGREADRATRTVLSFNATLPVTIFGAIHELDAKQAQYIPDDDPKAPLKGAGSSGSAHPGPLRSAPRELKDGLLTRVDDLSGFPRPCGDQVSLDGDSYFLQTRL